MANARTGGDPLSTALAEYRAGHFAKATQTLRRLLKAQPDHAEAHNLLGASYLAVNDYAAAATAFRRAVAQEPAAGHHHNLGLALALSGDHAGAAEQQRIALELAPGHAGAMSSLGNSLRVLGDADEALHWLRRAVQTAANVAPFHVNLAQVLNDAGEHAAAAAACRTAISLRPDHADAQFLLAEICLRDGAWAEGWARYEHRFRLGRGESRPKLLVPPGLAPWNGSARPGEAVLLICEQGFGDTFLFVRFAQKLAARGIAVDVAVPPAVAAVIGTAPGVRNVVVKAPPARAYSGWLPLGSLPRILGTGPADVPAPPYLAAESAKVEYWRRRLEQLAPGRTRIGLAWAGNPAHSNDRNRSLTLAQIAPLAAAPCHFFGVQKGPPAAEPAPAGMAFTSLDAELSDFSDTAAALAALDLLVAVDTGVANLAGAMGVKTWALLGTPPEWRWGRPDQASPWYPGVRCWRQPRPGDWSGLVARVAAELSATQH